MKQMILPIIPSGKCNFAYESINDIYHSVFFQPHLNAWHIFSQEGINLYKSDCGDNHRILIEDHDLIDVENLEQKCKVFVQFRNKEFDVWHYYRILSHEISIGRSVVSGIRYDCSHLDGHNTKIFVTEQEYKLVTDCDVVVVNGKVTRKADLSIGDCIFIFGMKIIVGIGFLLINDGIPGVSITTSRLKLIDSFDGMYSIKKSVSEGNKNILFNRQPRRRLPMNAKTIKIEGPPMQLNGEQIPLMLRMGGSMVMGVNSLLMGTYTTILSAVLFPVLTSKYTDKQRKDYETRREKKYTKYLEQKEQEINRQRDIEEAVMRHNYPSLEEILSFVDDGKRLWERRKTDDDFLCVRIGAGDIPIMATYNYPSEEFDLEEDPLEDKMYDLVKKEVLIHNAPVLMSLVKDYVSGIVGNRKMIVSFIRRLILQIAVTHSYDEVKFIFLISEEELKELEFIKYLPHIWNDQKTFRYLATNETEAFQVGENLKGGLSELFYKNRISEIDEVLNNQPYYVVFALNQKLFDSVEIFKELMHKKQSYGISILAAFNNLPKECTKILQMNTNGQHQIIDLNELDRAESTFNLDRYNMADAGTCIRSLSNTNLRVVSESYSLPKMLTFLEMFGVGKIEHLNVLYRWKNNNPTKSLAAPVGVGADGSLFDLDLHEKFHGPHGLIAGMTGSGKSEFIITYILSLAVSYHPDEVAFLLIDYKGGGLAKAFEDEERGIHLPHLVGTITNLDGSAIQRSLSSIQSENMRRQRAFNEAKARTGESSIDIYDYQALYRAGKVKEPLPHLFIIADEFAELKQQEPDFMDKLISTARIGRSLGVHLILATQKPTGVVNDQILSNTKFRVCLKVQDKGDSVEMLNRPEAAEIRNTGRFYLQVGYNELFAIGQSAWCGAPYAPSEKVEVAVDDEIQFVDNLGQIIYKAKPIHKSKATGYKQIVEIVKYLSVIAEQEHISAKKLWLEPLPSALSLNQAKKGYVQNRKTISVVVGLVDDPFRQSQYPMVLNIQNARNYLIAGASGGGKSVLLQTVIYELIQNYTPEQLNLYILDFSSRALRIFANAPHCGAMLFDENEAEINQLMIIIGNIIEQRKELFAEVEVGNFDSYIEIKPLPVILLVIDNLAVFDELKNGRELLEQLVNLMKMGAGYGIKVLATVSNINDCSYRMQHEFGEKLALQAGDKYEYANILNVYCGYDPPKIPGRGLMINNGEGQEFQVALVEGECNEQKRIQYIKAKVQEIAENYTLKTHIIRVDVQKKNEDFESFCQLFTDSRIPLGYNMENNEKVAIPFQQLNSMSVYLGNINGARIVFTNLFNAFGYAQMKILVLKKKENSYLNHESFMSNNSLMERVTFFDCDQDGIEALADYLFDEIRKRTGKRKKICKQLEIGEAIEEWHELSAIKQWRKVLRTETVPVMVVFESMLDFKLEASLEQVGKYQTLFTMGQGYNIYYCSCSYAGDKDAMNKILTSDVTGCDTDLAGEKEESEAEIRVREIRNINSVFEQTFNTDGFSLLFGGRYDQQDIASLPYEYRSISLPCKSSEYNLFLMQYRKDIYRMRMPVQQNVMEVEDDDEMSIV